MRNGRLSGLVVQTAARGLLLLVVANILDALDKGRFYVKISTMIQIDNTEYTMIGASEHA